MTVFVFWYSFQINSNLGDLQFLYVDLVITTTVAILSECFPFTYWSSIAFYLLRLAWGLLLSTSLNWCSSNNFECFHGSHMTFTLLVIYWTLKMYHLVISYHKLCFSVAMVTLNWLLHSHCYHHILCNRDHSCSIFVLFLVFYSISSVFVSVLYVSNLY